MSRVLVVVETVPIYCVVLVVAPGMTPMDPDTSQSPAGSGIEVTLRYAGPVNSAELIARESLTMDERASVILRREKLLIVKSWLAT